MTERPILFSAPMVRAILAGRKTQTRRIVAPHQDWFMDERADGTPWPFFQPYVYAEPEPIEVPCPYGVAGDRLWVRESFRLRRDQDGKKPSDDWWKSGAWYAADGPASLPSGCAGGAGRLRPSIHMPRWASRITLEVTDVRVERVQDIAADDARAEGLTRGDVNDHGGPVPAFRHLWDSINGKRKGCSWRANPWVWAVSFRRAGET